MPVLIGLFIIGLIGAGVLMFKYLQGDFTGDSKPDNYYDKKPKPAKYSPTVKDLNDLEWEKLEASYPKGTKVILIPNEPNREGFNPNDLVIGTVVCIQGVTKANNPVVVIKNLKTGKETFTFSKPVLYSEEMEHSLLKLEWYDRWNIYSHGWNTISEEKIKNANK